MELEYIKIKILISFLKFIVKEQIKLIKANLEAYDYAWMREMDDEAREIFVVEKAKYTKQVEVAQKAMAEGFDDEIIARLTGLEVEEIETLRNALSS